MQAQDKFWNKHMHLSPSVPQLTHKHAWNVLFLTSTCKGALYIQSLHLLIRLGEYSKCHQPKPAIASSLKGREARVCKCCPLTRKQHLSGNPNVASTVGNLLTLDSTFPLTAFTVPFAHSLDKQFHNTAVWIILNWDNKSDYKFKNMTVNSVVMFLYPRGLII